MMQIVTNFEKIGPLVFNFALIDQILFFILPMHVRFWLSCDILSSVQCNISLSYNFHEQLTEAA